MADLPPLNPAPLSAGNLFVFDDSCPSCLMQEQTLNVAEFLNNLLADLSQRLGPQLPPSTDESHRGRFSVADDAIEKQRIAIGRLLRLVVVAVALGGLSPADLGEAANEIAALLEPTPAPAPREDDRERRDAAFLDRLVQGRRSLAARARQ